ncbi:hypothetical protein M3226_30105 [Neobacillus cucumis]|uniref:HEAT repeat domain-containing protein n=1 Tax=Neobacillus cucumis TaxID=1740721 RepID=UPI00203EAD75|nr:HEAT repeat domain-containing protein [Neobacillus cucumis]MCM3729788.1 hypothetical protein [Neobacillus cucumis]
MDIQLLRKALENDDLKEVENLLDVVENEKFKEEIPLLIEFLKRTNSHQIRNQIAICLSDIGGNEVVKPIIDMINDPKTLGYRGTLLYSLQPFDCSAHLDSLIHHLITGNFEVQAEAFHLIEAMKGTMPNEMLLKSIETIKVELTELERKHDVLSDTLQRLYALKHN